MPILYKIEPKSSNVCNTFYQMCKKYLEEECCLYRRKGGKVKLAAYHAKISSVKGEKKNQAMCQSFSHSQMSFSELASTIQM